MRCAAHFFFLRHTFVSLSYPRLNRKRENHCCLSYLLVSLSARNIQKILVFVWHSISNATAATPKTIFIYWLIRKMYKSYKWTGSHRFIHFIYLPRRISFIELMWPNMDIFTLWLSLSHSFAVKWILHRWSIGML